MPLEAPVPSPCINVCQMDEASGWCTGCFRTIEEIVAWGTATTPHKREVLADLPKREAQYFQSN